MYFIQKLGGNMKLMYPLCLRCLCFHLLTVITTMYAQGSIAIPSKMFSDGAPLNNTTTVSYPVSLHETLKYSQNSTDLSNISKPYFPLNRAIETTNNASLKEKIEESIEQTERLTEKIEYKKKRILNTDPIEGESDSMVNEFQNIMRIYHTPASSSSSKVQQYRNLLVRLNKMQVETDFLADQRDILKSAIRYRLRIKGTAEKNLKRIIRETSFQDVQDDAVKTYLSFSYTKEATNNILSFKEENASILSPNLIAYLDTMYRSLIQKITQEEALYLLESVVLAPQGSYQNVDLTSKVLFAIQDNLPSEDLQKGINFLFHEDKLLEALALIKVHVKQYDTDFVTLQSWASQLGFYKKNLIAFLRIYQRKSKDYERYISEYNDDIYARGRGRTYYNKLNTYRGMDSAPYLANQAERVLNCYLKGSIEKEYAVKNAKRAFRNFLAYKKYDKVVQYATLINQKMGDSFVSPYINFWASYSLLKQGQTNEAIPLLGSVVARAPESYCGIMAQNELKNIFNAVPFSSRRFFAGLKEQSTNSQQALIDYAHTMYYLGNRIVQGHAENILVEQGLLFPDFKTKISSSHEALVGAYTKLGVTGNVRQLAYLDGIKSVYRQDVILSRIHQQEDEFQRIMDITYLRAAHKKNSYILGREAMKIYYPKPYQETLTEAIRKSQRDMDSHLLYSIIRTESLYKEKALSHAGARGLMQIMPVTGTWLMDKHLPHVENYSLYTPEINLYLGSVYLYENIDRMGFLPALAAYNSGPTFVSKFTKKYNPRTHLELAEIHPKQETRNYIKKVIESYEKYSYVYNNEEIDLFKMAS